jgi:hypothetical protein
MQKFENAKMRRAEKKNRSEKRGQGNVGKWEKRGERDEKEMSWLMRWHDSQKDGRTEQNRVVQSTAQHSTQRYACSNGYFHDIYLQGRVCGKARGR